MASALILDITDVQAVMTCAGVTAADVLPSEVIASGIEDDAVLDLFSKVPTYKALIAAGTAPAATDEEKMILLAITNYVKWFCATLLCMRWNSIIQLNTDGKTRMDRFDRMDLEKMQANASVMRDKAFATLLTLLPESARPTRSVPKIFGISSPTINPVTDLDA